MAIHGKNAELRVTQSETALSAEAMSQVGATYIYQLAADKRNWKYQKGATQVTIVYDTVNTIILTDDSPYIHYAGGAILLPPEAQGATIDSVTVDSAISRGLALANVASLPSCTRSFEINIEEAVEDATCFGSRFMEKEVGIPDWKGSLEGLFIDQDRFDLSIQDADGQSPRPTMRFRPDPANPTTYIQGTALFPNWGMSFSYDSLGEETQDFEGTGPLEWVVDGVPHFPNEVTAP